MPKSFEECRGAFLGNCFIKARAPGSYFWCGEHAVLSGQLAVIHAVPLYAYVGFEPKVGQEFEFEFREVKRDCNIDTRKGTDGDIVQVKRRPGTERVKKYLDFWKKQKMPECFLIKVWSEIPSRCGLNQSGAALAAIASIMQVLEVQESERESLIRKINKWEKSPIQMLKRDPVFRDVFTKSWVMDSCAHNFFGDGAAPLSSLLGSPNGDLLLHFTERKTFDLDYSDGQLSSSPSDLQSEEILRIEEKIKTIDWWGKRIPIREDLKDWLAIALVYCGIPADTAKILPRLEKIHRTPLEDFRSLFSDLFPEVKQPARLDRPMSDFIGEYNGHKPGTKSFLKAVFRESLGLLSWEFVDILKQGDVTRLLNHVIAIHKFMDFYGVVPEELSKHLKAVKEESNIGVKLTGAGGGGDLVVFGESDSMEGIEDRVKQSYHIHYSTNKMGWKADGVSVWESSDNTVAAVLGQNTVEIGLSKTKPYILINREEPRGRLKEQIFVTLVLLAAARMKDQEVDKIEDLLLAAQSPKKEQLLTEIRDFLMTASFETKVDRRNILPSDGRGNVRLQVFQKEFISIYNSICTFESQHMVRTEKAIKELLQRLKMGRERGLSYPDKVSAGDQSTFFEQEARLTFRHTRIVMKAVEMMGWKFQNKKWWKRWDSLAGKCREVLECLGYDEKYVEETFYLPQRGRQ